MTKISVIIPVYNSEKFLKKCLDSIINQTLNDIEIICIDDGSTDKSLRILNNFADKDNRITIINQKNSGPSAARVAVCGIKRLRSCKWKYHLKIEKEEFTTDTNKKLVLCDVPDKCYVWNKIYKLQKLIEKNINFEQGVYFEDRCFTAEVLVYLKSLVTVPDVYYNYWTNHNSIVKTKSDKKIQDSKYTKEKMMKFLNDHDIHIIHKIKKFKLFGLTYLKIKYYRDKKEIKLFNIIKINV